jgi:hypothetical protein
MRGYATFTLVLISIMLVFSLLTLFHASQSTDLTKAVAVQRSYGIQMNVKESIIESARAGALHGFAEYDATHDIKLCKHCGDHFCVPPSPQNPYPPNICNQEWCGRCFREAEAREAASVEARNRMRLLDSHVFDPDFQVTIGGRDIKLLLRLEPPPLSKNGFAPDSIRFRTASSIRESSEKFGIDSENGIPKGMVVFYEK